MAPSATDPGAMVVLWVIRIAGIVLVALSALVGMLPRNRLAGIRLPYTMADDGIWRKAHRRGRWFLLILGLCCFAPIHSLRGLIVFTVVFMAFFFVSSLNLYLYARREYREKFGTTKVISTGFCKFRPPAEEEKGQID